MVAKKFLKLQQKRAENRGHSVQVCDVWAMLSLMKYWKSLSLLSGGLLVFAYPRWDQEWVVWIWLWPLLAVIWAGDRLKKPFRAGYLAGLAFFIPNLFWIRHSSRVLLGGAVDHRWAGFLPELTGQGAVIGLSGFCALYFGLWTWFVQRYARPDLQKLTQGNWQTSTWESLRCALLASGAWVACEWLRSTTVFTGFGWNGLGVALHQNRVLIQAADLVGVMGLSFLPVLISCSGWNAVRRMVHLYRGTGTSRTRLDFTLAMVMLLAAAGYGVLKVTTPLKDPITVRTTLVQPNVAQVDAWSGQMAPQIYQRLKDYTQLYGDARDTGSSMDLIIWPESALPVHLHDLPDHVGYFNEILKSGEFSLLTGTEIDEPGVGSHVSAVLFRGSFANRQEHHKVHLVPFGEYLPLRDIPPFSLLKGLFPGDFRPGQSTEPLKLAKPEVQIIPLICFEDSVGRLARRFVRAEPQMIVNITNDGWFLQSEQTEVHAVNAKFRAIELRRPMVRATNTGVTCFIDTLGTVTQKLVDPANGSPFIEGCLPGEVKVPREAEMTLYARFGDWFAIGCLLACALCLRPQRSA